MFISYAPHLTASWFCFYYSGKRSRQPPLDTPRNPLPPSWIFFLNKKERGDYESVDDRSLS